MIKKVLYSWNCNYEFFLFFIWQCKRKRNSKTNRSILTRLKLFRTNLKSLLGHWRSAHSKYILEWHPESQSQHFKLLASYSSIRSCFETLRKVQFLQNLQFRLKSNTVTWPYLLKYLASLLLYLIFQYVGDATIDGQLCTKWAYNVTVFERNNSYVFYATKTVPPKPVYFEMNGYDTLLVSYYDKYVIKYHSFEEWDYDPDDDPDVFEVPHRK